MAEALAALLGFAVGYIATRLFLGEQIREHKHARRVAEIRLAVGLPEVDPDSDKLWADFDGSRP